MKGEFQMKISKIIKRARNPNTMLITILKKVVFNL